MLSGRSWWLSTHNYCLYTDHVPWHPLPLRPLTLYILASVGIPWGSSEPLKHKTSLPPFHASILVDVPRFFCSPPPPCPPLVNDALWLYLSYV